MGTPSWGVVGRFWGILVASWVSPGGLLILACFLGATWVASSPCWQKLENRNTGKQENGGEQEKQEQHRTTKGKTGKAGQSGKPQNRENWKIMKNWKTGKQTKWTYNTNCENIENGNYGTNVRNVYKWEKRKQTMGQCMRRPAIHVLKCSPSTAACLPQFFQHYNMHPMWWTSAHPLHIHQALQFTVFLVNPITTCTQCDEPLHIHQSLHFLTDTFQKHYNMHPLQWATAHSLHIHQALLFSQFSHFAMWFLCFLIFLRLQFYCCFSSVVSVFPLFQFSCFSGVVMASQPGPH